jgi:hypothetical protein
MHVCCQFRLFQRDRLFPRHRDRHVGLGCLLGLALVTAGCSEGEVPVYPIRGKVLDKQGKPAAGAIIVLQPMSEEAQATRAVGIANENGEFKLTTRNEGDGAPAGEFVVTVIWPTPKRTPLDPEGPDQLNGVLATADKSKIRFRVEKQPENEILVINLP